jgi:CheY-like chemotaxis protein
MVEEKNIGYSLGATDYLVKPVSRDQLATLLQKYNIGETANHILIVEDDTPTREMMARLLTKVGCRVSEAANGWLALQAVELSKPDLILLDLMMPEMDGFEFVARLRQHPMWTAIPIVVLTAKDISLEEREQLQGHVQNIFQKAGYQLDQLLTEMQQLLTMVSRN